MIRGDIDDCSCLWVVSLDEIPHSPGYFKRIDTFVFDFYWNDVSAFLQDEVYFSFVFCSPKVDGKVVTFCQFGELKINKVLKNKTIVLDVAKFSSSIVSKSYVFEVAYWCFCQFF